MKDPRTLIITGAVAENALALVMKRAEIERRQKGPEDPGMQF